MKIGYKIPWTGRLLSRGPVRVVVTALVSVVVIGLVLAIIGRLRMQRIPDFASINDIGERKAAFFSYMEPFVEEANREIMAQRKRLVHLEKIRQRLMLNPRDEKWIRSLGGSYGMSLETGKTVELEQLRQLKRRVDIIPPSMALAQAAIESGWGTSRFARIGNNLFGMWCYEPGCGIVPRKRPKGATYEVARYHSPGDSIQAYMLNLNSNSAYADFRRIRFMERKSGDALQGLTLSDGLYRYSSGGWNYVNKVQNFIRTNKLSKYDEEVY